MLVNLKEIAKLRLENPDMSLTDLGKILKEPIGKSGVNYRLKKIIELAKDKLEKLEIFIDDVYTEKEGKVTTMYIVLDTKKEEFPVSLQADDEVTNGTIVKIFDIIRENGYSVINLRTKTE